jgi:flavin reductase (DIM6/NTAB) family NADH-FMN oxidoreductase RutF
VGVISDLMQIDPPMQLDPRDLKTRDIYHLMTSLLVPRPIAWVGSRSAAGVDNLAPFSYFMGVSSKPPALAISVARARAGAPKDTAANILETGVFTVSMVSRLLGPAMKQTAAPLAPDVSEFEAAGLEVAQADLVDAPRPAVARVTMECRCIHTHDMGSTHLLVGEILRWHFAGGVLATGPDGGPVVDVRALDPIARLGGADYTALGEVFSL